MKKSIVILLAMFLTVSLNAQTKTLAKNEKKETQNASISQNKAKSESTVAPISEDPSIFIEMDNVDYGTIEKGSDPLRTINVTNKGAKPLLIQDCSASCGCTVPTCPREPIMPGKSAKISIKYDTNKLGVINKSVTIISNDPKAPAKTIQVKGNVINPK